MDYDFERLDPERFQQFCQALLVGEIPGVQCFPVGQPDGGRDAVYAYRDGTPGKYHVFQVKFVRNPFSEDAPHKALLEWIASESPKVRALLPKGASQYTLLTNVAGTAHLDVGSIDRANKLLTDTFGIPSRCVWRDDLARQLDNKADLRWAYPELLRGGDLLRLLVESGIVEDRDRRAAVIRAFVVDQFRIDQDVRFRQVELQNRLMNLFVDVPIRLQETNRRGRRSSWSQLALSRADPSLSSPVTIQTRLDLADDEVIWHGESKPRLGAAQFYLDRLSHHAAPRSVLEGAPGQGKSTITQYVCQVHRTRLLSIEEELSDIPPERQRAPVRLPIKVDLRDLAAWFAKKDPFSAKDADGTPEQWIKSLEGFLAALIRHHSGGGRFDVADLLAVIHETYLLLVFDGLDEVADISKRKEVVDEILCGVARLETNAASLQVIVTSRPAAFANSAGLPEDTFVHHQLGDLTRELVEEYAGKWMQARQLPEKERAEVRRTLREKLDQPHLRDLARNPMQLAILLSLIHTRGSSLPDKRTALYDSYVDLFFSREAEKTAIVRTHRDLLLEVHRYLGWLLHAEAEEGNQSGRITADRLRTVLEAYLRSSGRDPDLATQVFYGMVERVVALVSRVQGTFEFEVQPLREYFAARHLYETAPYSPPGGECGGTKPDRFDAIARNFYWFNATRFYAGCYSKGELPSLVDRLQELASEKRFRLLAHPRLLAATLLADWVFSQHPTSVHHVVDLVLDEIGIRLVLAFGARGSGSPSPVTLPAGCGQEEVVKKCVAILDKTHLGIASEVIPVLSAHSTPESLLETWATRVSSGPMLRRRRWLRYGLKLGILGGYAPNSLLESVEATLGADPLLDLAIRARRHDFLEASPARFTQAVDLVLAGRLRVQAGRGSSPLEVLALVHEPARYAAAFLANEPRPLEEVTRGRWAIRADDADSRVRAKELPRAVEIRDLQGRVDALMAAPASEWATSLAPWNTLVEESRRLFGERWVQVRLANVAAGIRSQAETCKASSELFNRDHPLCARLRYARLRAGSASWWLALDPLVSSDPDAMQLLLASLTWTSDRVLVEILPLLSRLVAGVSSAAYDTLSQSLEDAREILRVGRDRSLSLGASDVKTISARMASLMLGRMTMPSVQTVFRTLLVNYDGPDRAPVVAASAIAALEIVEGARDWKVLLKVISRAFARGVEDEAGPFFHRGIRFRPLALKLAEAIASNTSAYPVGLLRLAEATCRSSVGREITPVGKVARAEGWFKSV